MAAAADDTGSLLGSTGQNGSDGEVYEPTALALAVWSGDQAAFDDWLREHCGASSSAGSPPAGDVGGSSHGDGADKDGTGADAGDKGAVRADSGDAGKTATVAPSEGPGDAAQREAAGHDGAGAPTDPTDEAVRREAAAGGDSSPVVAPVSPDVERRDCAGMTPLLLALRLGRREMALRLLRDARADVRAKGPDGLAALHHCLQLVDVGDGGAGEALARAAFVAAHERALGDWTRRLPRLCAALEALPDFSCRIGVALASWLLPRAMSLSRLLPSDTVVLRKRGALLRLDCTLAGFAGLREGWRRSDLSYLFLGRGGVTRAAAGGAGGDVDGDARDGDGGADEAGADNVWRNRLVLIDWRRHAWADVLADLTNEASTAEGLRDAFGLILQQPSGAVKFRARDAEFTPVQRWFSSEQVTSAVGPWLAAQWEAKGVKMVATTLPAPRPKARKRRVADAAKGEEGEGEGSDALSDALRALGDDAGDADFAAGRSQAVSLQLRRGEETTLTVPVPRGGLVVAWRLVCEAYDVDVTVRWRAAAEGAPEVVASETQRAGEHSGHWACDAAGVVAVCVSNAHAWARGKVVTGGLVTMNAASFAAATGREPDGVAGAADGAGDDEAADAEGGAGEEGAGDAAASPATNASGDAGAGSGDSGGDDGDDDDDVGVNTPPEDAAGSDAGDGEEVDGGDDADGEAAVATTAAFVEEAGEVRDVTRAEMEARAGSGAPPQLSFREHFGVDAPPGVAPEQPAVPLGKPSVMKRSFTAKVSMAPVADGGSDGAPAGDAFPLPVEALVPVAEVFARSNAHMQALRRFLTSNLPPGFPVQFEAPLVATVTATYKFEEARVFPARGGGDDDDDDDKGDADDDDRDDGIALRHFAVPASFRDLTAAYARDEFFKEPEVDTEA